MQLHTRRNVPTPAEAHPGSSCSSRARRYRAASPGAMRRQDPKNSQEPHRWVRHHQHRHPCQRRGTDTASTIGTIPTSAKRPAWRRHTSRYGDLESGQWWRAPDDAERRWRLVAPASDAGRRSSPRRISPTRLDARFLASESPPTEAKISRVRRCRPGWSENDGDSDVDGPFVSSSFGLQNTSGDANHLRGIRRFAAVTRVSATAGRRRRAPAADRSMRFTRCNMRRINGVHPKWDHAGIGAFSDERKFPSRGREPR